MDKSKMSNLISINVQEIEPVQSVHHSARTKTVSYLVSSPDTITTYRHDLTSANIDKSELDDVRDYFEVRQLEINTDYKETHNNRNIKKDTKLYQEAVISFGREQFENCDQSEILKSLESFSDNFEQKYGCKILMTSLHLDEGHKSKDGTIEHNYHAHVLIENYSFETHKTCLQKLDYRKLQTDLAKDFEHLGFERGKDYRALQQAENQLAKEEHRKAKTVKPVRLEHREYREMKEIQSELELENIQLKDTIKKIEQPQENHAQLKTENAEKSLQILQLHEQLRLAKEQYDADRKKLKDSGEAKQADYQKLKIEYDQTKLELENNQKNYTAIKKDIQPLTNLARKLKPELKSYGEVNAAVIEHIEQLTDYEAVLKNDRTNLLNESDVYFKETAQLKNDKNVLVTENKHLKLENDELKTALERFLDTPIVKRITEISGTLLERLNSALDGFTKHIDTLETEKQKLSDDLDRVLHPEKARQELARQKQQKIEIIKAELAKTLSPYEITPEKYNLKQMQELDRALKKGLDISHYKDPAWSADQMYLATTFQEGKISGLADIKPTRWSTDDILALRAENLNIAHHKGNSVIPTLDKIADGTLPIEELEKLIYNGANVNESIDSNDNTPVILSAKLGKFDEVKLFLRNGADANAVNLDDESALSIAIKAKNPEIIEILREYGAEIAPQQHIRDRDFEM